MAVKDIAFSAGFITVTRDDGPPTKYAIAEVLRALDIPTGLTYSQVGAITTLANLVVVLIRTLIAREVIGAEFLEEGEIDLEAITEAISDMGGDYSQPDLTVT